MKRNTYLTKRYQSAAFRRRGLPCPEAPQPVDVSIARTQAAILLRQFGTHEMSVEAARALEGTVADITLGQAATLAVGCLSLLADSSVMDGAMLRGLIAALQPLAFTD